MSLKLTRGHSERGRQPLPHILGVRWLEISSAITESETLFFLLFSDLERGLFSRKISVGFSFSSSLTAPWIKGKDHISTNEYLLTSKNVSMRVLVELWNAGQKQQQRSLGQNWGCVFAQLYQYFYPWPSHSKLRFLTCLIKR